jgi:hypothetical protein
MKANPLLVMARPHIEEEVAAMTTHRAWHAVTCATAECSRTVWAVHHALQADLEERHVGGLEVAVDDA